MKRLALTIATAALVALLAPRAGANEPAKLSAEETKFFESKVRPILAANCYKCHSAEERKNKGGLTLDTRDGWAKGGKHGPAIVPRDTQKSLLLKAVRFEDPDLQMPPNGDKLKDEHIATLEKWVKMGAPDPRRATAEHESKLTGMTDAARAHWAYQPVKSPTVPEAKDKTWIKSPVDAFVLAKLESEKMKPQTPAPREALIRRATFDLIGLPPTPEEVQAFVRDRSPDAFAKVVDRLLASPHYGERWGRYWLDTARYSDTTGNENKKDEYRYPHAWTYRDYVINSFNADKPYNAFLKEQIAADLMPEAKDDPARLAGLGFLTVGKRFQNVNDLIDERIDAVTKATMALTVSCARCHDHKFDPIPTADYYSLHGVFASTTEPVIKPIVGEVPTGPAYDAFRKELAEQEADARGRYYELFETKSNEFRKRAGDYLYVAAINARKSDPKLIKLRNDILAVGKFDRDIYGAALRKRLRRDDPVFAPVAMFAQLPEDKFAEQADEVIPRVQKQLRRQGGLNPIVAKAFESLPKGSLKTLRDVTAVYGKLYADADARAKSYFDACRKAKSEDDVKSFDEAFVQLINVPGEIEPEVNLTYDRMRELAPTLPIANERGYQQLQLSRISELMLTHPGSPARAMVVADKPTPKDSPIFIRGEQQNRGDVVPRQFLEIIAGKDRKPFTKNGSGRLELAEAIASKDNPLTARVMVNRIWMHHFGQGFVRTPDDLGVQSEAPSHPELLDYLATHFMKNDWSVKNMHRLIMLSSTYQQDSETNNVYAQKDPENRLLWRANLRRLDFEAVRDTMLMFTGKLDSSLGGKPVNLTDEPYSNRRSVYGYIDRGDLPELMSQFDFADPDMANSKRTSTIVPQQALFFMNSPMAVDVARKVTTRPEFLEARNDAQRVAALYEVLFQRPPRASEVRFASEFLQSAGAYDEAKSGSADDDEAKPMSKKEQKIAERAEQQKRAREKREMERLKQKKKYGARGAIRNQGEIVERKPLTPWEQYAQALLFTNEIVYVN